MICEREMSLASDGKQLKKVMTECPIIFNTSEHLIWFATAAITVVDVMTLFTNSNAKLT